jgi:predicted AlkP superfamily pyrophosphatase or phosphodiesterase
MGAMADGHKKLVLTYVDSLRTDMLERTIEEGNAPTFEALLERGNLVPDCVSSFPSVTPVACAEMVTGVAADRHWISGMNWYHRLERRYVEYGSSLEATRAVGVFRALYDLVYNMNLAHLSPEVPTLFESLDDAGARTACTPFLIYRGRHRHQVSLEGLVKRAVVDAGGLKFDHHTWGPGDLFYGDLYASREVPCKSTSIPGNRDSYAACCAAALARDGGFDFLLLSLPDNDNHSHRHGPEASVDSIARADECFATLVEAAGGLDRFLDEHAVILVADHSHSEVDRGLPLADLLGQEWSVLKPSEDRPDQAQLAVSPTGRAAHVYLLPAQGEPAAHDEVRHRRPPRGLGVACFDRRDRPRLPPRGRRWRPTAAARHRRSFRRAGLGSRRAGRRAAALPARRPSRRPARRRLGGRGRPRGPRRRGGRRAAPEWRVPGPARPRLRGADGAPRRRHDRLAVLRL